MIRGFHGVNKYGANYSRKAINKKIGWKNRCVGSKVACAVHFDRKSG
jgi:hypothetical protein